MARVALEPSLADILLPRRYLGLSEMLASD